MWELPKDVRTQNAIIIKYLPNWSFPHPVAIQSALLYPNRSSVGKHITSMWGASSNGSSRCKRAKSLCKDALLKPGWMDEYRTSRSAWGEGSMVCCVSHSPHRTRISLESYFLWKTKEPLKPSQSDLSLLNNSYWTQWAAVRMTFWWMSEPPHR